MSDTPLCPDPTIQTYDAHGRRVMVRWGVAGAVAAVSSLVLCIVAATIGLPGGKFPVALLAASWAVLPPIWFWWEYFGMYRTRHSNKGTWELFKHGQQLGVGVWAGIAASIGAFALSSLSDPKPAAATVTCTISEASVSPPASVDLSKPHHAPDTFELRLRCVR